VTVEERVEIAARGGSRLDLLPEALDVAGAGEVVDFLHEAHVGGLGRVRDEAEDGVVHVVIDRLQHPRGERAPERLALAVDLRIVAAAEVDPFERALPELDRVGERLVLDAPVALHDENVSGAHRLHAVRRHVEDVGERGPLGGDRHHLIVDVEDAGADAGGIAADERVAVAHEGREHVPAVPALGGLGEHAGEVQLAGDLPGELPPVEAAERLGAHRRPEVLVLAVEEVADPLEDDLRVRLADRVQPVFDELVEQVGRVGHVEVAGDREVPAAHVVLAGERVAVREPVARVRPVPQVTKVDVGEEFARVLHRRVVHHRELARGESVDVLHHRVADPLDRVVLARSHPVQEFLAGRHVELDGGEARAVLSAVVLLLHEQVHAPQPPRGIAVPIAVVRQRLTETHQGEPAFVADEVAHGRAKGTPSLLRQQTVL